MSDDQIIDYAIKKLISEFLDDLKGYFECETAEYDSHHEYMKLKEKWEKRTGK